MNSTSALVLLSGGQDSTTCLFWAREQFSEVRAVSIVYGQRHAIEVEAAKAIAEIACVPHSVHNLAALGALGDSALVSDSPIRDGFDGALPTSFVPARNLMFLSLALAIAHKYGIVDIVTGVCQTDYSGYPDCRREFIDAFERTAALALGGVPIRVHTPLMQMTKAETVHLAKSLHSDCWRAITYSVTCYEGQRPGCGACPACVLRANGFAQAGASDPAV
jgi:7-cyano-7-deazaguanine synthase